MTVVDGVAAALHIPLHPQVGKKLAACDGY